MKCAGFNHLLSEQKVCGIYKITSSNFKIYIGQSVDIGKRIRDYIGGRMKTQRRLRNSVAKHGWPGHVVEVLQICEMHELDELEKHYIKVYDTFNTLHGMNLTEGGNRNTKVSDETRRKMRESHLGLPGNTYSKESRERMSNAKKGKPAHVNSLAALQLASKGRIKSKEEIEKLKLSKIGKPRPVHVKQKLSEIRKVPILLIRDMSVIELESMEACSIFLGRNRKSIRKAILNGTIYRGYLIFYL